MSTVGTASEVYHYLRLLFAFCGVAHCPGCGVATHELGLERPREEGLRATSVVASLLPLLPRESIARREERLVSDEAHDSEDAQGDRGANEREARAARQRAGCTSLRRK